jgi:hypothetical protein
MTDPLRPEDERTVATIQDFCLRLAELRREVDDPEVQARLEEAVHNAEIALEIVYGYREV